MKELRQIARFIDQEFREYTESAVQEVAKRAPKTTPTGFDFWFGKSAYRATVAKRMNMDREMTHVDFLEVIMATYLADVKGVQLQGYRSKVDVGHEGLSWGSLLDSTMGQQTASNDVLWINFLPPEAAKKLGRGIASRFEGQLGRKLSDFPQTYSKRSSIAPSRSYETFKEVIAHEETHYFATTETIIGELQREAKGYNQESSVNMSDEEFMEYLMKEEEIKNRQEQASEVSHDENILGIEEIFAHFVGFQYLGKRREIASSYARDEYINWGVGLLYQEAEGIDPGKRVDWARLKMKSVLDEVAQRGQVRESGGYRDPFAVFLQVMLPKSEKERIRRFREVAEGDLASAFRDMKKAVKDIEGRGQDKIVQDAESFVQEVDWDNPSHIEDMLMHKVLEEAVGNYGLEEIHRRTGKLIQREIGKLEELVQMLKRLDEDTSDHQLSEEIEITGEEILQTEKELKRLSENF